MWHAWWKYSGIQRRTCGSLIECVSNDLTRNSIHVGDIKGIPIEVKSLDVINSVLQERMARGDGHERIVETDRKAGWRYPINGEKEVEWLQAFYIEIKIYAAQFVENKVSDYVRALNLYSRCK